MKLSNRIVTKSQGRLILVIAVLVVMLLSALAQAQTISNFDRERDRAILSQLRDDLKKNYYDPSFHGIDLDKLYKKADDDLKQVQSNAQAFGVIAQMLLDLGDSHVYFVPPGRSTRVEYGWEIKVVGDAVLVGSVKTDSDAYKQGLRIGDTVLSVNGFNTTRQTAWRLNYLLVALAPQEKLHITVQKPTGEQNRLEVESKVEPKKKYNLTNYIDYLEYERNAEKDDKTRLANHKFQEFGQELIIWKMPGFDLADEELDKMMKKVENHKALIIDMRGNHGGSVPMLESLAGYFFDHEIKIADYKGRKALKPSLAKAKVKQLFSGKLILLVDANSASAAEVFPRLIQIEKRGTVIGDRTGGAVMRAQFFTHTVGLDTVAVYGASITDADVIMTDGHSLEKVGVTPDILLLPTALEVATKRDKVLSRAAELAGVTLDPTAAGALFPEETKK